MAKDRLRESLREGAVVVISILVAFGLDAWWDHRGDLREEAEIIAALEAEFTSNRKRLMDDIEEVRGYTDAAQRLLEAAESGVSLAGDADTLGADLWRSLNWRTANVSTAALDAVVSSGRLDLIRDDELRTALAGWKAQVDDMAEEEMFEWREIIERYRPYLGRIVAIPSLEGDSLPPVGLPAAASLARLLSDLEFRSHLSMRLDVSLVALRDKEKTLMELERVLNLLHRGL